MQYRFALSLVNMFNDGFVADNLSQKGFSFKLIMYISLLVQILIC